MVWDRSWEGVGVGGEGGFEEFGEVFEVGDFEGFLDVGGLHGGWYQWQNRQLWRIGFKFKYIPTDSKSLFLVGLFGRKACLVGGGGL